MVQRVTKTFLSGFLSSENESISGQSFAEPYKLSPQ